MCCPWIVCIENETESRPHFVSKTLKKGIVCDEKCLTNDCVYIQ